MGLHSGFLVATTSQELLLEELSRHAGQFTARGTFADPQDAYANAGPDGDELLLGERDGGAFLIDSSMLLADGSDLVVAMSERLGTVAGCGAETVSGTFWLTVARDGELVRLFWAVHSAMTGSLSIGEPLACERNQPIDEVTGGGIYPAMAELGLDPGPWLRSGPVTVLEYDFDRMPPEGPIGRLRDEHYQRHRRTGERPPIVVRAGRPERPARRWFRRTRR